MTELQRREIDHNYDSFQRQLMGILPDHEGEYALMHRREVVGFYQAIGEAYREGLSRFPDRLFSIQLVTREPVELGNWSVAIS